MPFGVFLCYNSSVMPREIRVAIETLGCKLNQAESETLARQLAAAGCQIVGVNEKTDAFILNTCTVTHIADRKCRQSLRAARRNNPNALIVATGCYANCSESELWGIPDIDLILKNKDKDSLSQIVAQRLGASSPAGMTETGLRTRAFIKAQDGCNRRCAYCIVPMVRGREKSLPSDVVMAEIQARVADDYKEVVLTGTEVGSYSSDGLNIKGLLRRILAETKIERLRVSSLQPYEITPELLALWKNSRLCPHFHISLQSGADVVLNHMKRGYSTSEFEKALKKIRETLPEAATTTDVIVGFPGETDAEFQQTVDFCRRVGFARIHVFAFSPRPGTAAADMTGQVDARIKKERSAKMLALAKESAAEFRCAFLGRTLTVLWEQKSNAGVWSGYTSNYIRIYTRSERNLTNVLTETRLVKLYRDGVWGEPMNPEENK
ncbi:MAG: tRNA (N(6)-L-threonylcarbamoyladenosine(37)-C(2))-methylthiotransferase MtaB [Dehalococcoidia bacterium]|nr:MAG: tRNA (N(6)-L-threonylcarbamoyladenosine(37)-C(2))-methylthiotransferase MtaB [Dehalococcoidia bacterium]